MADGGAPANWTRLDANHPGVQSAWHAKRVGRLDARGYLNLLQSSGVPARLRLDANETMIFARQLEYIEQQMFEVQYAELRGAEFVPVKTGFPEGVESYTYRVKDRVGRATRLANGSSQVGRVDVIGREVTSKFSTWGAAYGMSVFDVQKAAMANLALEDDKASAMRRAIAEIADENIWIGDSETGTTGFLNNTDVPLVSVITGSWASATGEQMVADMFKLEDSIITATLGKHRPTSLLLDSTNFGRFRSKKMADGSNMSAMAYFIANSRHCKEVDYDFRLATANAAGNAPRAIMYARDPRYLQALVAIEYAQLPPQFDAFDMLVHGYAKFGGVAVYYPKSMAYMDGLGA